MTRPTLILTLATATLLAAPLIAQEAQPGLTGIDRPAELVEARRDVMRTIASLMGPVQTTLYDEAARFDADGTKLRAEAVGGLLAGFPHLFAPTTNPASPEAQAAGLASDASAAIWDDFEGFYAFAKAGKEAAAAVVAATDDAGLRTAVTALQAACDDCHAQFLNYSIPIPSTIGGDADVLKNLGF